MKLGTVQSAGAGLVGGAVAAAMIVAAGATAAHADDLTPDIGLAASSGNQYVLASAQMSPGAAISSGSLRRRPSYYWAI